MLRYVGTSREYDDIGLGFGSVDSMDAVFGDVGDGAICEMDIVLMQRLKPAGIKSGAFTSKG